MELQKLDDPRDRLGKATRWELIQFARQNNVAEIDPEMPAMLMRDILRRKGITNIQIPNRLLGSRNYWGRGAPVAQETKNGAATDAVADLARQWQEQKKTPVAFKKSGNQITDLRRECKARGIKISRRDTIKILKEKLAAHGENAA